MRFTRAMPGLLELVKPLSSLGPCTAPALCARLVASGRASSLCQHTGWRPSQAQRQVGRSAGAHPGVPDRPWVLLVPVCQPPDVGLDDADACLGRGHRLDKAAGRTRPGERPCASPASWQQGTPGRARTCTRGSRASRSPLPPAAWQPWMPAQLAGSLMRTLSGLRGMRLPASTGNRRRTRARPTRAPDAHVCVGLRQGLGTPDHRLGVAACPGVHLAAVAG